MHVTKNFSFKRVLQLNAHHFPWLACWATLVAWLHWYFASPPWLRVPWSAVAVIGTAVAFYLGFKNNSAYDRMWEARKIWGSIINSSRSWGSSVRAFIGNQFTEQKLSSDELKAVHRQLLYRHIAWLYQLRTQLLVPQPWEHVSQHGLVGIWAKRFQRGLGVGLFTDSEIPTDLLPPDESAAIKARANPATMLIDAQSQQLSALRVTGHLDDFRHVEMQKILNELFDHQGKCERLKKFPLPRQYGAMSVIFVGLFIFLLPLSLAFEFTKLGEAGMWLSIPFTMLISWIYLTMELIGDYSEFPFQGMANDIPMLSMCRTIEIDLRDMLGESPLPRPIEARNGILM